MPIRSIGCVHTHQGIPTNEGWGSLSHIRSVIEKIEENNRKARKISRVVNQTFAPRWEHHKIQAKWASDIPLKSMLKKVWWCKQSKMECWSWTICCMMNCTNGGRHAWAKGNRNSHATLKCCQKGNLLSLTRAKASRRNRHLSTINLTTMIETTRA
jgi:hypothetical protein